MREHIRYMLASAGIEATDELVAHIEETALEAVPVAGLSPLVVVDALIQVLVAYGNL